MLREGALDYLLLYSTHENCTVGLEFLFVFCVCVVSVEEMDRYFNNSKQKRKKRKTEYSSEEQVLLRSFFL